MKKMFALLCGMILVFAFTLTTYAQTTINASLRKHHISVTQENSKIFGAFISDLISPKIVELMKEELLDDAMDIIIRFINFNVMDIIQRDENNDGIPDILGNVADDLKSNLLDDPDILLNPTMKAVEKAISDSIMDIGFMKSSTVRRVWSESSQRNFANSIAESVSPSLKPYLIDFIENDLVEVVNDSIEDLIEDIPELLRDLTWKEMPDILRDLVDDEIPGVISDAIADYMPRELDLYVASIDLRTDITQHFAVGLGIKGIGLDTLFIPEASLSLHFNLINNNSFRWDIFASTQRIFLTLENGIQTINIGSSVIWQPMPLLTVGGDISLGNFVKKPLIDDIPDVIINYEIFARINLGKNSHLQLSYSKEGLSDLTIAYIEHKATGKLNPGYFNLSAGFHF